MTLRRTRPWLTALAVLLFVWGVWVVGSRTRNRLVIPGEPGAAAWGMLDFRDAVYYPVVAFLDGNNPYDPAAYLSTYPVGNVFALYAPLTLLVHLPFGVLPFLPSAAAYFLVSVACMVGLAHLTLRMGRLESSTAAVLGVAFGIVISQPGQWNLFLGHCAALIAVAAYGALYLARRRPWLAGLCLAVASIKPTTGIPLALLMFVRGERRAVLAGVAATVLLCAIPLIPLVQSAGGVGPFLTALNADFARFMGDPTSAAATSPYRVDMAALVSRLLGWSVGFATELAIMLGVLGVGAVALRRLAERDDDEAGWISSSLVCVAVVLGVYHPSNEALLLAFPIVMAGRRLLADGIASPVWWLLFAASALPAVNYLLMGSVVARMHPGGIVWLTATSLSGLALLIAFCVLCGLAWKGREVQHA